MLLFLKSIMLIIRKIKTVFIISVSNVTSLMRLFFSYLKGYEHWDETREYYCISLTTYNKRFSVVWLTLISLIYQKQVNFKVELWLSDEDYLIRTNLIKLLESKFKDKLFVYSSDDDKSLKKINSFKINDKLLSSIITADDDVYYPKNWLSSLVEQSKKYKNSVIFNRAWEVTFNNGVICPYGDWQAANSESTVLFFTGVGGVLYPREIANMFYKDSRILKQNYINADDVLLNYLVIKYEIAAVFNKFDHTFTDWIVARFSALGHNNVTHGRNDKIIQYDYKSEVEKYAQQ